jgi:hypothetical protein
MLVSLTKCLAVGEGAWEGWLVYTPTARQWRRAFEPGTIGVYIGDDFETCTVRHASVQRLVQSMIIDGKKFHVLPQYLQGA